MPTYDFECLKCGEKKERIVPIGAVVWCQTCSGRMEKYWGTRFPSVHGDEIDETIENLTAQPQHFTSRSEKKLFLKMLGAEEHVRHVGMPGDGSDKSPHTVRWVSGLPPGVDGRPMSMLSPKEQEQRTKEWTTLGEEISA